MPARMFAAKPSKRQWGETKKKRPGIDPRPFLFPWVSSGRLRRPLVRPDGLLVVLVALGMLFPADQTQCLLRTIHCSLLHILQQATMILEDAKPASHT
ncbi:MAG: hypothetical protein HDR88_06015 [Bacteroides sp.]|nr:hypothetical protein [Bacteroides sp.]